MTSTGMGEMDKSKYTKYLLLITLLAAVLRLTLLTQPDITQDELYSVRDAIKIYQKPIKTAFRIVKVVGYLPVALGMYANGVDFNQIDSSAPNAWLEQGVTPLAIRVFPVLIGIVTIPILALASFRMFGAQTTLMIAFLLAISPWHIYWSRHSRFYITQFLFFSLALIYYFYATREGSRRYLLLAMGCVILAFLSQLTAAVFFFIIGIDWLINRKGLKLDRTDYVIIILTALFLGAILMMSFFFNAKGWNKTFFQSTKPPTLMFGQLTLNHIRPMIILAGLLALLVRSRAVIYLLLGAVIPVIVFSALSFRQHAGPRYAFMCLYPWVALAGISLDYVRTRWSRVLAWGFVMIIAVSFVRPIFKHNYNENGPRRAWKKVAKYVQEHYQPGEKVIFLPDKLGKYYLPGVSPKDFLSFDKVRGDEQGIWIVLREKDQRVMDEYPFLSQAELQTTFILRKKKRKMSKAIYVYYLPS